MLGKRWKVRAYKYNKYIPFIAPILCSHLDQPSKAFVNSIHHCSPHGPQWPIVIEAAAARPFAATASAKGLLLLLPIPTASAIGPPLGSPHLEVLVQAERRASSGHRGRKQGRALGYPPHRVRGEGLGPLLQTPRQFRDLPRSGGPHQTRQRGGERVGRAASHPSR